MLQWCNPLSLLPEQPVGKGSIPGRIPPLERYGKRSRTQLNILYFCAAQCLTLKTATPPLKMIVLKHLTEEEGFALPV